MCFLVLSFGLIAPQISELRGVKNRTFPLTRHIAYTTACSYRSSCDDAIMWWSVARNSRINMENWCLHECYGFTSSLLHHRLRHKEWMNSVNRTICGMICRAQQKVCHEMHSHSCFSQVRENEPAHRLPAHKLFEQQIMSTWFCRPSTSRQNQACTKDN